MAAQVHVSGVCPNVEVVKFLVSAGADVNIQDDAGNSPFHVAVYFMYINNIETLELFVSNGADVNAKNGMGSTPLHLVASGEGKVEAVKFLVSHGADVNATNNDGMTPLDVAKASKDWNANMWGRERLKEREVVEYLESVGAKSGKDLDAL